MGVIVGRGEGVEKGRNGPGYDLNYIEPSHNYGYGVMNSNTTQARHQIGPIFAVDNIGPQKFGMWQWWIAVSVFSSISRWGQAW